MNGRLTTTKPTVESPPAACLAAKVPCLLCVDDHEPVRDEICSKFIELGWDCQSASGGEAALQLLASGLEPVDILVTDHNMPGMNGLELVRKVRTTNFAGKILVHSALLLSLERAAYQELNVDAIVPKTGNPEPLLKAVEALMNPAI